MKKFIFTAALILVGCSSAPKGILIAQRSEKLHLESFNRSPAQVAPMPCPSATLEGQWAGPSAAALYNMDGASSFQADITRLLPDSIHSSSTRNMGFDTETVVFTSPADKQGTGADDQGSFHHLISRRYFVAVSTNSYPNEQTGVSSSSNKAIVAAIQADFDDFGIWPPSSEGNWFQIKSCTVKYKYLGIVNIQPVIGSDQ